MKKFLLLFLGGFVLGMIWWQARSPIWSPHLQVDVWISWLRIEYFMQHGNSFAGMSGNEILPMTLLYILLPKWLSTGANINYASYLGMTLVVNLLVIATTWLVTRNRLLLIAELLFLGPILLFRFDGMVMLLTIAALLLFEKRIYALSGAMMGMAIGMKVFPIIIVPYLLLILWHKKMWREALRFLIGMGEALLVPIIIFWMLGGNWEQVTYALSFHNQKLISIESVPGSLITLWSLISRHMPPELLPGNGIWSVAGPAILFNKLWMLPVALLYFVLTKHGKLLNKLNWSVPFLLIIIFLIFSKNLNPQYLWWYMALLPFATNNLVIVIISCMTALLNQLVYPIFYTTIIENFYRYNMDYWVYYLLLLRNLGVLSIAAILIGKLWQKKYDAMKEVPIK